MKTARFKYRW